MLVAFYTLGCKVNSYETESLIEMFEKNNHTIVEFNEFADVYIINTCMVTNSGEAKSKKFIRRPSHLNKDAIVIVMGCLSQLKADEMLEIDNVKIVVGTKNRHLIPEYLEQYLKTKEVINGVTKLEKNEAFENLFISDFKNHQRAFLKIQDGCNNFCSYCIIPYTRGRVRSKSPDLILKEAKELVQSGHKEIVLTGIHTGGFGTDLENYSFANLLSDLDKVEGLLRIRISSIEITELTDEVIEVIKNSNKIVNHLHIPLQGGSDHLLKAMNRKYTTKEYFDFISKLRKNIKNLAITTDVIVGFPGETEQDFEDTCNFIKVVRFQELHVFPFSSRTGTVASKMKNQVNGAIKKARVKRLLELSDTLKHNYIKDQLGTTQRVIIEQLKNEFLQGHTTDYLLVRTDGEYDLVGKEIEVELINYDGKYIYSKTLKKG